MGTITYVRNITSETILVDMVFVRFLLAFGRALRMVVKNIRVSGNNDHLIINKEDESMQLYEFRTKRTFVICTISEYH